MFGSCAHISWTESEKAVLKGKSMCSLPEYWQVTGDCHQDMPIQERKERVEQ
jgi:hypothetical protein